MLIGMLLRNYKIYYGINYIPIKYTHNFTSYVGDNGIGKSSILEALDTYFNNKDWNINNYSKTRGMDNSNIPYIFIILTIKKDLLIEENENKDLAILMDEFFRIIAPDDFQENQMAAKELVKHIIEIKDQVKDEYIIGTGIQYGNNNDFFSGSFENKLKTFFEKKGIKKEEFQDKLSKFNNYIRQHFSYVYIPVEIDVEDFTKLEKKDIQKLMGKDIRNFIKDVIQEDSLRKINKELNEFINKIKDSLQPYFYHNKSGRKNISMNELVDEVIKLFFAIRTLHKKSNKAPAIPVSDLSSGEKRQVIIDIAESFVSMQDNFEREIIIAIDEPESSLNISKKFNQFEKLSKLSKKNVQIIITTHWYGFLPVISKGNLFYLFNNYQEGRKKIDFLFLDLYNYREKIKQKQRQNYKTIPQEIDLKSINDLVQSIVASLKAEEPYNWLICEGSSEKIYFEYYLRDLMKSINLRILPVGGFKEVKRIYEYLILPLKDKDLSNSVKGKIFCLVDTDEQLDMFESNEDNHLIKILKFRRLWNNKHEKKTELLKMHDNRVNPPTEIEDCLEKNIFYQTIKSFDDYELELKENMNEDEQISYFAFDLRDSERENLKKWFDKNNGFRKIEFAKRYVEIAKQQNCLGLPWINEIENFFKE